MKVAKATKIKVGSIAHLENGGKGLTFKVKLSKNSKALSTKAINVVPAFAIRYKDTIYAYKNICGHIAVNLDYNPGHFFDEEGEFIICATHGAHYSPESGKCMGGPCFGVGLDLIQTQEEDGVLYIIDESIVAVTDIAE